MGPLERCLLLANRLNMNLYPPLTITNPDRLIGD
jgi:hypothetical protein